MVRTVHSLFRMATMAGMLLVIGAIGIGRLGPGREGRTSGPGFLVGVATRGPASSVAIELLHLLDVRDGTIRSLALGRDDRVDLATGSPWLDGWDEAHVAGRWMSMDPDGTLKDAGLARVAFPSGRVLDRVSLDCYPIAPPCWGAGTSARVLFVGGDGAIFRYDFEASAGAPGHDGRPGLRRIRWRVAPGEAPPIVLDITRPEGVLAPDLVLATLLPRGPGSKRSPFESSEIWWLRLGQEEDEILDFGPLTAPDPEGRDVARRRPTLGRRADGTLWLVYLSSRGVPDRMSLRIAPARIDEQTGIPAVDARAGIVLADSCLSATPMFTDGGHHLTCLTDDGGGGMKSLKVPLDDAPSPTALADVGLPPGL